jgi:NADPH:quinone reductase-like Zn-dependent oxidoreductase
MLFLIISIGALALVIGHTSACQDPPVSAEGPDTMKAITYNCYGSPEVLQYGDIEKPVPGDEEVLVKVKAASVNPLDWHYMRGSPYAMRLMSGIGAPDNPSMGVDFAGTVISVGSNVTRFKSGDAVFGGRSGAFGEYLVIPESRAVALKPDNVSFEDAAAVPIAAVTALQALRDKGRLKPGQKVLINGASGGVGTYAVQIAKAMGAEVHGVCSTRNVDMVKSIGADRVFDYKRENYTESDERYDLIIDNVGNHSPLANTRVMNDEGILVMVGGGKGNWLGPFTGTLQSLYTAPFVSQKIEGMIASLSHGDLEVLAGFMAEEEVRSVIDRRFTLDQVPEAIAYSETGRARGKIIVNVE